MNGSNTGLAPDLSAKSRGIWYWAINETEVEFEESWRRILQYGKDQKISWLELIHPEDLPGVVSKILKLSAGVITEYNSRHRVKNGKSVWCWVQEMSAIDLKDGQDAAGRIRIITQLIDDEALVRDQVVVQERFSKSARMESIGHLTAGIAHDFNNLLAGILGYAELSMEVAADGGDARDIKEYLTHIMSAGNRAKELITQMLLYSRIEPASEEEPEICLLKPILTEVVQLGRSSIPRSIDVNYCVMDDSVKVRLHPVNLHQILLNLVINARDAIREFGKIEISQSSASIDCVCSACNQHIKGYHITVAVHDTGHGIPGEIIQKIFDPFFTTKELGKGTGMGLAVAQELIHRMGGHITVKSKEGTGSTVTIYLPEAVKNPLTSSVKEIIRTEKKASDIEGMSILVIDDEITITNLLTELLTLHGAKVSAFNRPDKALSEYIRNPDKYHVVITDATMPEISGIELSRAILQLRPMTPILICTGYSGSVNEESAYENGISGYMKKPLEFSELLAWLQERRL